MDAFPAWPYPKISRANYLGLRESLWKAMMEFGPPGAAIYLGTLYQPAVEPAIGAVQYEKDANGALTAFGGQMYLRDAEVYAKEKKSDREHCQRGILFLWRIIEPDAESAMKVQSTAFAAAKAAMDLPAMVALLDRVLLSSSEANQHKQLSKLVEL